MMGFGEVGLRGNRFGFVALVAAGLVLAGCGGSDSGSDDVSFGGSSTTELASGASTSETTEAETTTTSEPTTSTTLSAERIEWEAQVAQAEAYLELVTAYKAAWSACTFDLANCDFGFNEFLTEEAAAASADGISSRIASGLHYKSSNRELFFVQSVARRAEPLTVEVWICESQELSRFRRDADGNEVEIEVLETPNEFEVYEVIDQPDGSQLINQIRALDDDGDPKPEGGSCDAYREWPPPPP